MSVHVTVWVPFKSLGSYARKRDRRIRWEFSLLWIFLRNRRTVFHSGYTLWHSHQRSTRLSGSPHPCQHFSFSRINSSHLNGCEMVCHLILIRFSLMICDVECCHLYVFLEETNVCWGPSFISKSGCLLWLLGSFRSSSYNPDINPLLEVQFVNILSRSVDRLSTLFMVPFDADVLNFDVVWFAHCFLLYLVLLVSHPRNHCQVKRHAFTPYIFL